MKTKAIMFLVTLASVLSGCTVLSFYPLYSEDVLIRDDRITGRWYTTEGNQIPGGSSQDTLIWEISFPEEIQAKLSHNPFDERDGKIINEYTYALVVYDPYEPGSKAEFLVHLVKLGDRYFVDFFPVDWEENYKNTLLAIHLMGVHTFARIDLGEQLKIQWFDGDFLEELLAENKIRIRHEYNGAYTLLTAEPEELQNFVQKYADEKDAFSEGLQYDLNKY
jgi:hypothetical protein